MNRNLGRLVRLSRNLRLTSKRMDHHHGPFNPGPPITFDYMPIPKYSHESVLAKLNKKFNGYLMISTAVFLCSLAIAIKCDILSKDAWLAPESYRYRNKNK